MNINTNADTVAGESYSLSQSVVSVMTCAKLLDNSVSKLSVFHFDTARKQMPYCRVSNALIKSQ